MSWISFREFLKDKPDKDRRTFIGFKLGINGMKVVGIALMYMVGMLEKEKL